FRVVGVFAVGMFEYDSGLALIAMQDAQKLYRMEDRVSGVRLKLKDLYLAPQVARELADQFGSGFYVDDWTQQHASFFRALRIEKNMMFIILSLIVAIAAFNIVSMLVMVVTDKQGDIAILRTLGAAPTTIMKIFIIQGAVIGLGGTLLGVVGGVVLAHNVGVVVPFIERIMGVQFLAADVYYITELPSNPQLTDIVLVAVLSFLLTLLSTLYPSWRAAKTNPVEALRYE
ncbi:MAG: FtsX-like permease family protein, partial [Burkholderiales bacterium]